MTGKRPAPNDNQGGPSKRTRAANIAASGTAVASSSNQSGVAAVNAPANAPTSVPANGPAPPAARSAPAAASAGMRNARNWCVRCLRRRMEDGHHNHECHNVAGKGLKCLYCSAGKHACNRLPFDAIAVLEEQFPFSQDQLQRANRHIPLNHIDSFTKAKGAGRDGINAAVALLAGGGQGDEQLALFRDLVGLVRRGVIAAERIADRLDPPGGGDGGANPQGGSSGNNAAGGDNGGNAAGGDNGGNAGNAGTGGN